MWPVVASIERIDGGSPSEFSEHEYDGRIEQVVLFEFGDKSCECGVECLGLLSMSVEVVGVGVPTGKSDFDGTDSCLDQSPRDQAASAKLRIAVELDGGVGFVVDLEGVELTGAHHGQGAADHQLMLRGVGGCESSTAE